MTPDFSFARYVSARKGDAAARLREGAAYAYGGDLKFHATLRKVRPVTLAMEAMLRFWQTVGRTRLLGDSVRVSERQFPNLHELAQQAAKALQIPAPAVYVTGDPSVPDTQTFGTVDDATVLVNGRLLDAFTETELLARLGYEYGHVQNGHTIYLTTLYYLKYAPSQLVRWVVKPATLALKAWARRADITSDRASLLASRSLDATIATLVKLTLGSQRLYGELDVEEYLRQLDERTSGAGRLHELFAQHPYLPKRVQALRLFAETTLYRSTIGEPRAAEGGAPAMTKEECDAKVAALLSLVRGAP
jgi:Zn-dependent protease with chaperone function